MADLFGEKIEAVKQSLHDSLAQRYGKNNLNIEVLYQINRPFSNSAVLKVVQGDFINKYVMKSLIHHPVNQDITESENQALVEFNILRRLYPYYRNIDDCSVPEPILVLPEIETYVMGFVDGELLMDKMHAANYFSSLNGYRLLKKNYLNVGRWLKRFQEVTGYEEAGKSSLDAIIDRCDKRLKLIEDAKHRLCPRTIRSDVINYLRQQQAEIKNNNVPIAGRHGDFGEWNIITDNEKITVIDFLGFREEPVAVDFLKMLMNFENDASALRASKRRLFGLKEEFLTGYGALPDVPIQVLTICEALHRICSLEASINEKTTSAKRKYALSRRLSKNLTWLIEDRGEKTRLYG
jgi:hypothetical protein